MLNIFSLRTNYWKNGTQWIGRSVARAIGTIKFSNLNLQQVRTTTSTSDWRRESCTLDSTTPSKLFSTSKNAINTLSSSILFTLMALPISN